MAVPSAPEEITEAWLSRALGLPTSITTIEQIGEDYGLASALYRVKMQGPRMQSVVVKLWSLSGLVDAAEVHFYRDLAPLFRARLPHCHHAALDDEGAVLVLEDLLGRQGDVLVTEDVVSLEAVTSHLAAVHAQWWDHPRLRDLRWLRDGRTPRGPDWVRDRQRRFSQRYGSLPSSLANQLLTKADAALRIGKERLGVLPPTLAHGDLHLDNILFVDSEPILLDWAGCRQGPALPDLTAVVFGMGTPEWTDRLIATYRTALIHGGVEIADQEFEAAMTGAVLWSFVYWTLGTALWEPADARGEAMQRRHIDDAVRMVEFWANRNPSAIERVLRWQPDREAPGQPKRTR